MSIVRSPRPDRGFTIISNHVAQDTRLSMRALGLLVRLLSRPDNWQTNSTILSREFGVGREQMQSVLRELSSIGYMSLVKNRNSDGTITSQWFVFDEPKDGNPAHGEPEPGNPYAGEPVCFKQDREKKNLTHTPQAPKGADRTDAMFSKFWETYPKKVGKDAALSAFKKRKPTQELLDDMLKAIEDQKRSEQWVKNGGQFIPNPATWINQGRWQDGENMPAGLDAVKALFPGAI